MDAFSFIAQRRAFPVPRRRVARHRVARDRVGVTPSRVVRRSVQLIAPTLLPAALGARPVSHSAHGGARRGPLIRVVRHGVASSSVHGLMHEVRSTPAAVMREKARRFVSGLGWAARRYNCARRAGDRTRHREDVLNCARRASREMHAARCFVRDA